MEKSHLKSHNKCESLRRKKTKREVKMHNFFVCKYNSQYFVQYQENFARLHDSVTVTFRNSGSTLPEKLTLIGK